MGCFSLHSGRKKEVTNSTKSVSYQSSNSTLGGPNINKSGSELNSYTSTESLGKNNFPSISQSSSNLRVFSYQELKAATKMFCRSGRLGEGGFGYVYKGLVKCSENPSIKQEVAVKQLGKRGLQGHKEWLTEVNVLGVIEHPNLVKLIGYCADDDERGMQRLLVYEYMPNGSVEDHLTTGATTTLSWPVRLRIAQDAARGLAYLHEGMDFQIIFRDFKSSNILLDEQWNAKLSDFGLARFGPEDGKTHVSTAAVGTMGYAAPEYVRTGRLSSKSDVWSYGVFLYELITGRRPIDKNQPKSEQNLLQWVKPYLSNKSKFEVIVDPRLGKDYPIKSVHKLSLVANHCLIPHHRSRPKMTEVLRMVTELVESSSDLGRPEVVMARNTGERDAKEDKNGKRRRSSGSGKGDGGWLSRIWRRRVV